MKKLEINNTSSELCGNHSLLLIRLITGILSLVKDQSQTLVERACCLLTWNANNSYVILYPSAYCDRFMGWLYPGILGPQKTAQLSKHPFSPCMRWVSAA
jgi:hypothetical protein